MEREQNLSDGKRVATGASGYSFAVMSKKRAGLGHVILLCCILNPKQLERVRERESCIRRQLGQTVSPWVCGNWRGTRMAHLFHGNKIQIKAFSKKKLFYISDIWKTRGGCTQSSAGMGKSVGVVARSQTRAWVWVWMFAWLNAVKSE